MDRKHEHLTEDSNLRPEFINQVSWDEWALANAPFFLLPEGGRELVERQMKAMNMEGTYEDALYVAVEEWRATLDPETRLGEQLYLQGHSKVQRKQIIDQQHALLRNRAIELGLIEERPQDSEFREQFGE